MRLADDMVTARGTVTGRHKGSSGGPPAAGREVEAVAAPHRGEIAETRPMADRPTLVGLVAQWWGRRPPRALVVGGVQNAMASENGMSRMKYLGRNIESCGR